MFVSRGGTYDGCIAYLQEVQNLYKVTSYTMTPTYIDENRVQQWSISIQYEDN